MVFISSYSTIVYNSRLLNIGYPIKQEPTVSDRRHRFYSVHCRQKGRGFGTTSSHRVIFFIMLCKKKRLYTTRFYKDRRFPIVIRKPLFMIVKNASLSASNLSFFRLMDDTVTGIETFRKIK